MRKQWIASLLVSGATSTITWAVEENPCRECERESDVCWRMTEARCVAVNPPLIGLSMGARRVASTSEAETDACDSNEEECLTLNASYTTGYNFCVGTRVGAEFGLVACPGGPKLTAQVTTNLCTNTKETIGWETECCAQPGYRKVCRVIKYVRPVTIEVTTRYFSAENWEWRPSELCDDPPAQRSHCSVTFCTEDTEYFADESEVIALDTETTCCQGQSGIRDEEDSEPGKDCDDA